MKNFILLTALFVTVAATAQKTETFYDYSWKPCPPENARFYSVLEKTDSGWFRKDYFMGSKSLQMQALYEDSACKIKNGYYYYFHANGRSSSIGRELKNKQEGICIRHHPNGMPADSALYRNGVPVGSRMRWHRNGYMSDSIYHANDSMDVQISWFDDGAISSAGYLLNGKLHGKWKYYHRNGNPSGEVVYSKGDVVSKTYYNEDGSPETNTSEANKEASFKNGGIEGWQKYLHKNLYWPRGYEFSNGTLAVVVVGMTINEQGKPEDVEVVTPFHPEFDRIALKIIQNSPAWLSAVEQNRKVKKRFNQPVTFQQEE